MASAQSKVTDFTKLASITADYDHHPEPLGRWQESVPGGEGYRAGMKITPSGGKSARGPGEWFTGDVLIDTVRNPDDQSGSVAPMCGSHPELEPPGTHTRWARPSTSPTESGWFAVGGGEVAEIRPGDVVSIEPDEEHWHGATPDRFMAHVAMQEADSHGQMVTWLEHVTDEEYLSTGSG